MSTGVAELILAGEEGTSAFDEAIDGADAADVAAVLRLAGHNDVEIRRTVASILPLLTHGNPPTDDMVRTVIGMTEDRDARVRDFACFALGEQWREVDTQQLRDALAARLYDIDPDTRCEALVGLAYRQDDRALPRVREALSQASSNVWILEMRAAAALSDPGLHEYVQQHRDGWPDEYATLVADAAVRLTDPAGPGGDVIDGVAELCRRRAHGEPEGDALTAWHLMAEMLDIAPRNAGRYLEAVLSRLVGDEAALQEVQDNSALAQIATGD